MNTKIKVAAAVAWAAVGMAMAAPANAQVITLSTADYVTCSFNTSVQGYDWCDGFHSTHIQTMRFVVTTCGSGNCAASGTSYVDTIYSTGRKRALEGNPCVMSGKTYHIYELGPCAC